MGDAQSAQRDPDAAAPAEEEERTPDQSPTTAEDTQHKLQNNGQILELNEKTDGTVTDASDPVIVDNETSSVKSTTEEVSSVQLIPKESPDPIQEEPIEILNIDGKQNDLNESFRKFFSNIGLKLTVKKGLEDQPEEETEGTEKQEVIEETASETRYEDVDKTTDLDGIHDNDSTTCPTMTDGASDGAGEAGEENITETSGQEAHAAAAQDENQNHDTKVEQSPTNEEEEDVVSPIKTFFTTGIFAGLKKKKIEEEEEDKELIDMSKNDTDARPVDIQEVADQSPTFKKQDIESKELEEDTAHVLETTDVEERGKTPSTDQESESEITSSQEKVQSSPFKRLFSGSTFKRHSKRQKERRLSDGKLSDSGENTENQFVASAEKLEVQEKVEETAPSPSPLITEPEEELSPWEAFKKLMTPRKSFKKPSVDVEKVNVQTVAEDTKPQEMERLSDHSTEDGRKRKDSSHSWEAVLCGSGRRRSRKTSDSEGEQTQEGRKVESPNEAGELVTSTANQAGSSSDSESSTWKSFKKLMTPKRKVKDNEESKDNVQSDSEATQEETLFSIKKLLTGQKKRKSGDKQDQLSSDEGDKEVVSVEEDSETPAVVPLSEFDQSETEETVKIDVEVQDSEHDLEQEHSLEIPKTFVQEVQKHQITPIIPLNTDQDELTEFSKYQPLSDIPEEGHITDTIATSFIEDIAKDDTIAEDIVELTSEAITAPEHVDITIADETDELMLSAASHLTESSNTSGNTTPVPAEHNLKDVGIWLKNVVETISTEIKAEPFLSEGSSLGRGIGPVTHVMVDLSANGENVKEINAQSDAIETMLEHHPREAGDVQASLASETFSEFKDAISTAFVSEVSKVEYVSANHDFDEVQHKMVVKQESVDDSDYMIESISEVAESIKVFQDISPVEPTESETVGTGSAELLAEEQVGEILTEQSCRQDNPESITSESEIPKGERVSGKDIDKEMEVFQENKEFVGFAEKAQQEDVLSLDRTPELSIKVSQEESNSQAPDEHVVAEASMEPEIVMDDFVMVNTKPLEGYQGPPPESQNFLHAVEDVAVTDSIMKEDIVTDKPEHEGVNEKDIIEGQCPKIIREAVEVETEAIAERTTEDTTVFITEATNGITEATTEMITEATTEMITEATTEMITEATTETITEATTETITEATTETITEATTETITEATTETITEATTETITEPTTEMITEATSEMITEATTETITEATTETITEATTETITEATTETITEATTETFTEATTETITEATTEDFTDTEATIEATTDTEATIKATSDTEATTEATHDTEANIEATADTEATTEATHDTEATIEATTDTEATIEATIEATTDTEATIEATTDTEATTEATTDTEATIEATTDTEATIEATTDTEATTEATTDTEATIEATTDTEATIEATTDTVATIEATTHTEATIEATTDTVATIEATTDIEATTEATTDTEATTEATTDTEATTEATTDTEATIEATTDTSIHQETTQQQHDVVTEVAGSQLDDTTEQIALSTTQEVVEKDVVLTDELKDKLLPKSAENGTDESEMLETIEQSVIPDKAINAQVTPSSTVECENEALLQLENALQTNHEHSERNASETQVDYIHEDLAIETESEICLSSSKEPMHGVYVSKIKTTIEGQLEEDIPGPVTEVAEVDYAALLEQSTATPEQVTATMPDLLMQKSVENREKIAEETSIPYVDNAEVLEEPIHEVQFIEVEQVGIHGEREEKIVPPKTTKTDVQDSLVAQMMTCSLKDVLSQLPDVSLETRAAVQEPMIGMNVSEKVEQEAIETTTPLEENAAHVAQKGATVVVMHASAVETGENHQVQVQVVNLDVQSAKTRVDKALEIGFQEDKEVVDSVSETIERVDSFSATLKNEEEMETEKDEVAIQEVVQHLKEIVESDEELEFKDLSDDMGEDQTIKEAQDEEGFVVAREDPVMETKKPSFSKTEEVIKDGKGQAAAPSHIGTPGNTAVAVPQNTGIISSVGNVEAPSSLSLEFKLNIQFGHSLASFSPSQPTHISTEQTISSSPQSPTAASTIHTKDLSKAASMPEVGVQATAEDMKLVNEPQQSEIVMTEVAVQASEAIEDLTSKNVDLKDIGTQSVEEEPFKEKTVLMDVSTQYTHTSTHEEEVKLGPDAEADNQPVVMDTSTQSVQEEITEAVQPKEEVSVIQSVETVQPEVIEEEGVVETQLVVLQVSASPTTQTDEDDENQDVWMDAEEDVGNQITTTSICEIEESFESQPDYFLETKTDFEESLENLKKMALKCDIDSEGEDFAVALDDPQIVPATIEWD